MIISKDLVFIHLPKAGGTFVTKVLRQLNERNTKKILFRIARRLNYCEAQIKLGFYQMKFAGFPRHSTVACIPMQHHSKKIFTTIRNPYDWYVSNYEYGWFRKHPEEAGNIEDIRGKWPEYPNLSFDNFVEFANEMWSDIHDSENHGSQRIGWLTSSFVSRLCLKPREAFNRLQKFDQFIEYVKKSIERIEFLRMENLNEQLYEFLRHNGYREEDLQFILELDKIYPSGGGRKSNQNWQNYFTKDLIDLVRHRERLLFELFPEYGG